MFNLWFFFCSKKDWKSWANAFALALSPARFPFLSCHFCTIDYWYIFICILWLVQLIFVHQIKIVSFPSTAPTQKKNENENEKCHQYEETEMRETHNDDVNGLFDLLSLDFNGLHFNRFFFVAVSFFLFPIFLMCFHFNYC